MGFIIGAIVGLVVGWAIAYLMGKQKAADQAAAIQDLKRQFDLAESEHERRLREATRQLQKDYDQQLKAAQARVPAAPTRPAPTPAPAAPTTPLVSPPPQATAPTDSVPTPTPAPKAPEPPAPPIIATAPAPTPQPVTESPSVPAAKSAPPSQPPPARSAVSQGTDPNALLAGSYAADATVRRDVAQTIARTLSTASPKAQASWLPVVTRLTRDPDSQVRLQAVQALGSVKSSKRLPLLRRALRDSDPAVVQAANDILSSVKGRSRTSTQSTKPTKRRLPKNR